MSGRDIAPDPNIIPTLLTSLANRENGDLHDFKIKCDDREWKVHKLVLSMHSPVLHAACTRDFKEAAEGMIDLSLNTQWCIDAVVCYLYNLNYDTRSLSADDNPLDFHIEMCEFGDKYDIQPLKKLAEQKFKDLLDDDVDDEEFEEAVENAYGTLSRPAQIREHITDYIIRNTRSREESGKVHPPFEKLMLVNPELATDVCKAIVAGCLGIEEGKRERLNFWCPNCRRAFETVVAVEGAGDKFHCCNLCGCSKSLAAWKKHYIVRSE